MGNRENDVVETSFPVFYDDLDLTLVKIFQMLNDGVEDGKSPAHTPLLATVDQNNYPQVRTVVLRGFIENAPMLRFHTDARSIKVGELLLNDNVSFLIYDSREKIQIRIKCTIDIHRSDKISEKIWSTMEGMSQVCYQIKQPPGTTLVSNPQEVEYDKNAANGGKDNFAVVFAKVQQFEWLYLHHRGHRRAIFLYINGQWESNWLVP